LKKKTPPLSLKNKIGKEGSSVLNKKNMGFRQKDYDHYFVPVKRQNSNF